MNRTAQRLLVGFTLAALALVPAVDAGAKRKAQQRKAQTKTVRIFDNYFEPAKLKVRKGTTVVWKWPAVTGNSHDVTLQKGPKGVKRFQSEVAGSAYRYKRKLEVPGVYDIVCSLHEEMAMKIVVRR